MPAKLTMPEWEAVLKYGAAVYVTYLTGLPPEESLAFVELKLAENPDSLKLLALRCM